MSNEPHLLQSLKRIKEEIAEPHRSALLKKAQERGVVWMLKCVKPGGLNAMYNGVRRAFKEGEQKLLPAEVASFLWQKYNLNCVAGTPFHPSIAPGVPFEKACFEEVILTDGTDYGSPLSMRQGGASLDDAIVEERHFVGKSDRTRSEEATPGDIAEQQRAAGGSAKPLSTSEV